MINQIKKLALMLLLSAAFAHSGHAMSADSTSFSFNKLADSLCESAKNNQLAKIRADLLTAKLHIRNIYAYVQCDGLALLDVATLNQSAKVTAYLRNKVQLAEPKHKTRLAG